MCGIAGGWFKGEQSDIASRVESALAAMRLRGPDDQGYEVIPHSFGNVVLGHTRLSIIDLSSSGHQPMYSHSGRYGLIFNGEIYNYRELRDELKNKGYAFHSDSDTEVLLIAWKHWGRSCLKRLVGMFAFVVFDKETGSLTCVRDGFGVKPFFFSQEAGSFMFASELNAIKALKSEKIALDWQRSYDYLVHGDYDSGPRTFISGIYHLLPGHLLQFDLAAGKLGEQELWWQPSIVRSDISFEEATQVLKEKFLTNIRLHLRSDVALGAALSGGIDSSAVVCAMRHVEPDLPIKTFSYIAGDHQISEEKWVDQVNNRVNATPHKVVVSPRELARDLDDMILAQGEPFGSTSIYAQYRVFKLAKEHGVTVTLDGQGADELLAGYSGYPGQRIRSLLELGQYTEAWEFLGGWAQWPGRSRIAGIKRALGELASGQLYQALRYLNGENDKPAWLKHAILEDAGVKIGFKTEANSSADIGRRVVSELRDSLTGKGLLSLLRHADRNSMRFSVESRVPFLTQDMAEFLLSLPEEYLISQKGETKHIFRAAMRGIVPDEILNRRDKVGFETPEKEWLLSMSGVLREWLLEDLNLPFLNQQQLLNEFDQIVAGRKPFSWQVWRWVNFSRWHQQMFC